MVESTNMNDKKVMLDALKGSTNASRGFLRDLPQKFKDIDAKKKKKKQRSKSRMKQRNPGASSYSFGAKFSGKP